MTARAAVDLDRLGEFSDGTVEGTHALIRLFLEDIGETMEALRVAVARGNIAEAARLAHRAAGASGAMGAVPLSERLTALEDAGGAQDTGRVAPLMADVEAEVSRVRLVLTAYLDSRGHRG